MKHFETIDKAIKDAIFSGCDDFYVKDIDLLIHRYNSSIEFTYMANAMKKGKKCLRLSVSTHKHDGPADLWDFVREMEGMLENLVIMAAIDGKDGGKCFGNEKIEVYYSNRDSYHIFHPVRYKEMLKPVKEMPAKMTLAHIYKIIANGQYDYLKCNGVYTDDYAYDAAMKFQEGSLDAVSFLERIYNRPSGWWCSKQPYAQGGDISICCHSFDSNSIKINLSKGGKVA